MAAKKMTGRSADASAGAAAARKKAAAAKRARATGQTAESSMDAVGRRFKVTPQKKGYYADAKDRVSGVSKGVSTNPKKLSQSKAQSGTGTTNSRVTNDSLRARKDLKVRKGEYYGDLKQFFGK